jgi:hypothetical protein
MWTCSAASRSTRSATPTRRSSPRSRRRSRRWARLQPVRAAGGRRARRAAAGPRRPARLGVLRQLRRRGERGRVQTVPADGRTKIVAAQAGFHGRTMGALALTGQPAKQDPFRPLAGRGHARAVR